MWNRWNLAALFAAAVLVTVALSFGGDETANKRPETAPPRTPPQRIVSIAPSLTEVLFAVGAGDLVVGVGEYCNYPPAAREKPRVGGYYDTSYEGIVRLTPDLVLTIPSQEEARRQLMRLEIPTRTVDQRSIESILASVVEIGELCGAGPAAVQLEAALRARVARVREAVDGRERPSVLVSVGRDLDTPEITEVYVAGSASYHAEIIEIAGGRNAYTGEVLRYPSLSREGLLRLDPQLILELVPDLDERDRSVASIAAAWSTVGDLTAVRNGRVHVIGGSHVSVPGPRVVRFVEEVAAILHPSLSEAR